MNFCSYRKKVNWDKTLPQKSLKFSERFERIFGERSKCFGRELHLPQRQIHGTNSPNIEGITACRWFLDTWDRKSSTVGTETLRDLIRMILTMNNFTFNDKHYLQIHGTAEPEWHLLMPICSWPNLTDALSRAPVQATHMAALHKRHHDMDTFCWRPSCFHLLS